MIGSFGTAVGLRRAAAIIFALVAVLPLLAVLPVLHRAGVLISTRVPRLPAVAHA